MAINAFPKEIRVDFDNALEAYNDALVLSKAVTIKKTDMQAMERSGDVQWITQPYVAQSFAGWDQTANFVPQTQLAVPATLSNIRSVPFILSGLELRDMTQGGNLKDAARQKLASDINLSVMDEASKGTLVVKRTVAATGFDDIALCESIMNEQGIPMDGRYIGLGTRDYNGMVGNLAGRQTVQGKVQNAYEKALVGEGVANFDVLKLDYASRLQAAGGGGGITISTLDTTGQYYRPTALTQGAGGQFSPTDNRFQTVTVSSTTNVLAGDRFTIAALNAVHHITKRDTGQLKTFTVAQVLTGTTMVISPPIITNQLLDSDSAAQYQNCVINTKSATSAIVFLNTVAAAINPFWQYQSIALLPGKFVVEAGAGAEFMQAETDQGMQLTLTKQWDIKTQKLLYRLDAFWGTVNLQPEMNGIMLFNQT